MHVSRVLPDGKTTFSFDAASEKDVFIRLAKIDDLFNESECGCCKSKNIRFTCRKVENGFYLEMRCNDCTAQLDFGQNKEGGGIWVKKWDKENHRPMENGGWYIYDRESGGSGGGGRYQDENNNNDRGNNTNRGNNDRGGNRDNRQQQTNPPPPRAGDEDIPF